jgi:separase
MVIHVRLMSGKSSMLISRLHTRSSQPLEDKMRSMHDESRLPVMLEDALHALREIVRLGDESMRRAAHVRSDDLHARAGWWAERAALDKRLLALLENIENMTVQGAWCPSLILFSLMVAAFH